MVCPVKLVIKTTNPRANSRPPHTPTKAPAAPNILNPKPAYNTVSTIVRILESKGFVDHKSYGKTHEYFPIVSKDKYSKFYLNNMISGYFNGSFKNLVSFFAKENKLNANEIEELLKHINNDKSQPS
jgi:predicted transcriptional regulator